MPADAFRPRSTSEILDASIQLFRTHYRRFLVLGAITMLPQVAVNLYNLMTAVPGEVGPSRLYMLPLMLVSLVWFVVADTALLAAASDAYLGIGIDTRRALRQAFRRSGTVVVAAVIKGMLIMVGYAAVALAAVMVAGLVGAIAVGIGKALGTGLPGASSSPLPTIVGVLIAVLVGASVLVGMLVLFTRLFAYRVAIILEGVGAWASIRRSWNLVNERTTKTLLAFVLTYVICFAIYALAGALAYVVSHRLPVAQTIAGALLLFVYPIIPIVTTVLYYDLRIRKEGYDIELMARELERDAGGAVRDATGMWGEALAPEAVPLPASRVPHP